MTERTDPRTQKCSNFGVWASPGAACPRAWQYGKALPVHALWGFLSHELVRSRVLPSDTSSFLSYHLEYSACPRVTGGTRPLASPGAAREGSATRPHPPALAGEADRERGLPGQWRLRPGPLLTASGRAASPRSPPGTGRGAQHVITTRSAAVVAAGAPAGGTGVLSLLPFESILATGSLCGHSFCRGLHQAVSLPPKDCGDPNREPIQNRGWTRWSLKSFKSVCKHISGVH